MVKSHEKYFFSGDYVTAHYTTEKYRRNASFEKIDNDGFLLL